MPGKSVTSRLAFALLLGSVAFGANRAAAGPVDNGGPEITGTPHVYYIWYGNWQGNSALNELPNFVKNISGTAYLGTDKTMGADGLVTYGGSTTINSATNKSLYLGASLNGMDPNASMLTIVDNVLSHGLLPDVSNAIYDVLTAPGIAVSGFNTEFCGWHSSTDWGGNALGIQFGFIGDPTASQTGCYAQSRSPNFNLGADAMTSIIAHELIETVTDPTGTAWWDSSSDSTSGFEAADMCAWDFGAVTRESTGAYYNLTTAGIHYLVQTQWVNQGGLTGGTGACAMSSSGPFYKSPFAASANSPFIPAIRAPEPATLASFGLGLLALVFVPRRRQAGARAKR